VEVLYPRCAGLDVHRDTVVACVRIATGRKVKRELKEFGTSTRELLRLSDWMASFKVTHVAMESTGVLWKPVWHILSGSFELTLGNAKQMKTVPGKKSDQKDAEWIADLHAHGLVRPSFVPPQEIQELRDLTRTRKQMMRERAREIQRIQKILQDANVKLTSVLTDIMGASGRRILGAILDGETDPRKLAGLADWRVKASREQIAEALQGRVTEHHRFMISLHLRHIDQIDANVSELERRIEKALDPFRPVVERLRGVPGISFDAAAVIIAETGADMSVFPTDDDLVAWAGLSPGLNESAGKKKSTRTKRQRWLKSTMTQCGWAASKKRDSYFQARYHRIKARRGKKKAVVAVAASMLRAAYHIMKNGTEYRELGHDFHDHLHRKKTVQRLARRLEKLGYEVDLRKAA
jgi:transposase